MVSEYVYFYLIRPMIILEKLNDKKNYHRMKVSSITEKLKTYRKDVDYYTDLFFGESLSDSELVYLLDIQEKIPKLQKYLLEQFFKYQITNIRINKIKSRYML